jgi:hypothetical protein
MSTCRPLVVATLARRVDLCWVAVDFAPEAVPALSLLERAGGGAAGGCTRLAWTAADAATLPVAMDSLLCADNPRCSGHFLPPSRHRGH